MYRTFEVLLNNGDVYRVAAANFLVDADGVLTLYEGNEKVAAFSAGSWLSIANVLTDE